MTSVPEVIDEKQVASRAPVHHDTSGVMALGLMSDGEFTARLDAMKRGQDRVRRIQLELMVGPTKEDPEGEDYGVIPGTKKPTLLKPGAEKICNAYGLVPTFEETWIDGDGVTAPHLRVRMKCLLHRGDATGPVIGEGVGAANSWERKHRYRRGERTCPTCGVEGAILRSKIADDQTGDKGWFCWAKRGGCGANFVSTAEEIVGQEVGDVENKDPFDVENTLLKMAKKRSHVDATLTATATSGLFSQDLEDLPPGADGVKPSGRPAKRQPGEDDETVLTSEGPVMPGSGQHAAKAGAEANPAYPIADERAVPPEQPRTNGTLPACPKCGKTVPVMKSRYAKPGAAYYCNPKAQRQAGCGNSWE